jgi:hypothetical protein
VSSAPSKVSSPQEDDPAGEILGIAVRVGTIANSCPSYRADTCELGARNLATRHRPCVAHGPADAAAYDASVTTDDAPHEARQVPLDYNELLSTPDMIDGECVIVRITSRETDDESTAGVASIVGELRHLLSDTKPRDGYFLRAESFYNVARFIDSGDRFAPDLSIYGDVALHAQSHRESFLALAANRFGAIQDRRCGSGCRRRRERRRDRSAAKR